MTLLCINHLEQVLLCTNYTRKFAQPAQIFGQSIRCFGLFSRQAISETNPKSEYLNPKQTQRQINLKSGKSKTPNPKEACLEFYIFWSFEIVSNFGFHASNYF